MYPADAHLLRNLLSYSIISTMLCNAPQIADEEALLDMEPDPHEMR